MELLLFCLRFTLSAGYSMSIALSRSKCLFRNSASIRSQDRIMECVDKCLINLKMGCRFLQWDTETRTCFRYKNVPRDYHGSGVCLTMSKDLGTGMVDEFCLIRKQQGHTTTGGRIVPGIDTEVECRSIFLNSWFKSYIWNQKYTSCSFQGRRHTKIRKLNFGEVLVSKVNNCNKRCAVFTVGSDNAFSTNCMYLPPPTSLQVCLRRMISTSRFYELFCDLQGKRPCCMKLLHGYATGRVGVSRNVIKVSQTPRCNERKLYEEMCTKRIANRRMKGGISLPLDREGCEHFCRNVVNCAAVDWHSLTDRCQFHHMPKELINANGVTHYTVVPCHCSIETCGSRTRSPEFVEECNRYVAAKIDGY